MHSLTSFVEFTTASTSRFQGFPLHKYIFKLTSWLTGNFDTEPLSPLSVRDLNVKGSGKYELENAESPLLCTKECSASIHLGTWSKVTTESPLSFGNPPRDVAESGVATGLYISGTLKINSTNPYVEVLPDNLCKFHNWTLAIPNSHLSYSIPTISTIITSYETKHQIPKQTSRANLFFN